MLGNTIIAGFGGHCDNWNYTGMLVAVSKTPGVGITNIQATMASPGQAIELDVTQQFGGKAGIWQSGMVILTLKSFKSWPRAHRFCRDLRLIPTESSSSRGK